MSEDIFDEYDRRYQFFREFEPFGETYRISLVEVIAHANSCYGEGSHDRSYTLELEEGVGVVRIVSDSEWHGHHQRWNQEYGALFDENGRSAFFMSNYGDAEDPEAYSKVPGGRILNKLLDRSIDRILEEN